MRARLKQEEILSKISGMYAPHEAAATELLKKYPRVLTLRFLDEQRDFARSRRLKGLPARVSALALDIEVALDGEFGGNDCRSACNGTGSQPINLDVIEHGRGKGQYQAWLGKWEHPWYN